MTAPLLEVNDLHAGYGPVDVLRGVSFIVSERGITAILGANGAGKTTTLRAVCGMVRTRGSIRLGGADIRGRKTEDIVRLGVGHVPDGRGTFNRLSVEENLLVGAHTRRDRSNVVSDMAWVYGHFPRLKERRLQQAGTLSGGEQQMLAISRALMLRPRLLLLDEPSFGLAPILVQEIFAIMQAINRDRGIAILLIEQNADLALTLAESAVLLETGAVALTGSAADLRAQESVRRSYLGY